MSQGRATVIQDQPIALMGVSLQLSGLCVFMEDVAKLDRAP